MEPPFQERLLEGLDDEHISEIVQELDSDDAADVASFDGAYQTLLVEWDAFHDRYDEWRRTEGGCDRTKAIEDLGRFSLQFEKISLHAFKTIWSFFNLFDNIESYL